MTSASVSTVGETKRQINNGLAVLVGIEATDTSNDLEYCVKKLLGLKLWGKSDKQWQLNIQDIQGNLLLISQFTLFARTSKGTKPDFHRAMSNTHAKTLFDSFVQQVQSAYPEGLVQTGFFAQHMQVQFNNDGPVTIVIDSQNKDF